MKRIIILLSASILFLLGAAFLSFNSSEVSAAQSGTCYAHEYNCNDWWPWTNGIICLIEEAGLTCAPCGGVDGC